MGKIFEGIKVLDFTNNAAGPSTASLLADFGAEVIKVERPALGDDVRSFAPRIEGKSLNFMWLNRGKKSIEIALDTPEGVDIIKKIIPDMDIIVESFRPGVMKKFGLDYDSVEKIKPEIIYCSISAFGQNGPYAMKPGYDLIAQALSGIMDSTGEKNGPPQKSGAILGDYIGGLNAYGSIAAAMYHRQQTGEGQYIDVSLYEGLVSINGSFEQVNLGLEPTRGGNHHNSLAPYGLFNNRKGQSMIICAPNNKLWSKLCVEMGHPEEGESERFGSASGRLANLEQLVDFVETWLYSFEDISQAVALLDGKGIPCCKVQTTKELLTDEHLLARHSIGDLPTYDSLQEKGMPTIKARGVWNKFSKTPGVMGKAPDLGQHNYEILNRYGISKQEFDLLLEKWTSK